MTSLLKVSVITPMYNAGGYISQAIESVQAQTYDHWEMIIVDDCSTDDCKGQIEVKEYSRTDHRIKLIILPQNKGASGARNVAIEKATGTYLAFLDADDMWDKTFLAEQLEFMKKKDAVIAFSSYRRIAESSLDEILQPFIVPEQVNYRDILKSLPICPSTSMVDIGRIGKKQYFNEKLGSLRDDYVYWLSLLKNDVDFAYGNKKVLVSYRIRETGMTSNKFSVILPHWNVLRNIEKLSVVESLYYLVCWSVIGLKKYSFLSYRKK